MVIVFVGNNHSKGGALGQIGILRTIFPMLLILVFLGSCGKKEKEPEQETVQKRSLPKTPFPKAPKPLTKSFTITDIDKRSTTLEFQPDRAIFHKIRQPIVLITLFSDWCVPCRGMLPYLGDLQKKNPQDLFVIGVLVRSDTDEQNVRALMRRYEAPFFISVAKDNEALARYLASKADEPENYPLPLTLIFKNGTYVMSVAGAIPYEMMQNLVDQLKTKKEH